MSIFVQVARFFLRYGVKYQDLQDVLKEAIVEAAFLDSPNKNSNASTARIADIVGLPRRTVANIRNDRFDEKLQTESSVPAGVMLKIWHNDARYLDEYGNPRALPISESKQRVSIASLAEEARCSASVEAVMNSLEASGAVECADGIARAKARTFIMSADDENTAVYFGIAGSNLLSTLVHNTSEKAEAPPFFERTTWVSGINRAIFPRFSELVSETSVPFLELLDDWLTHRQTQIGSGSIRDPDNQVLGVGVYVFNREQETD